MIKHIFYAYGLIYIAKIIHGMMELKTKKTPADLIISDNPYENFNTAKKLTSKYTVLFLILDITWLIMGLYTPEKNLFITLILVIVLMIIVVALKTNKPQHLNKFTPFSIYQIIAVLIILYVHYSPYFIAA